MLERAGGKSTFVDGLRVHRPRHHGGGRDGPLGQAINKEIANWITLAGREADVRGDGLSGKDARLITVEKLKRTRRDPGSEIERVVDLGFVGEPTVVDPQLVKALIHAEQDYVPVIAPIGVAEDGETYNINADTVAGAMAGALKAKRICCCSPTSRACSTPSGALVRELSVADARAMIADSRRRHRRHDPQARDRHRGDPKAGSRPVVILEDGRRPHAMLVELFTEHGSRDPGAGVSEPDFSSVDVWIFEPRQHPLPRRERRFMGLVEVRMTGFVERLTGLPFDEARARCKKKYPGRSTAPRCRA